MTYLINEEFLEDVEKKLFAIKRKCDKLGNEFIYSVDREHPVYRTEKKDREVTYKFFPVTVEGIAKINDYEIVGLVEPHESGNVVKLMKYGEKIPERFRTTPCVCEHCNTKRNRTGLLVVHNTETDEYKQVGKSCLKLYTGGLDAASVASWYDELKELEEYNGRYGVGHKYYIDIKEILRYAIPIINKIGYFNSRENLPTKSLVATMLRKYDFFRKPLTISDRVREMNNDLVRNNFSITFNKDDFANEYESEIEEIINYYKSLTIDSDFVNNIKIFLNEEYVEGKNFGYICYLPEGYGKAKEKEREEEEKKRINSTSTHYGVEKQRYKSIEYTGIYFITSYQTQFGETYVYKIVLADGNVITWKSQKYMYDEKGKMMFPEHGKCDFTVKEHSEFRGNPQTIVTRVTFK